jgi:GR25 family glycosyltransferase involved in LPS biosynthesis
MMYLIHCVESRRELVERIAQQLPAAETKICTDYSGNAMKGFLYALTAIDRAPCVMLEDDVELTRDFTAKAEQAIAERPNTIIKFFDLSKIKTHSRYEPGGKFCSSCCIYLPAGYALVILDFYGIWPRKAEHPTYYDYLIGDFLKSRREKYYVHCPSLVQHLPVVSVVNRKRSRFRQSITFEP